jgi:hypothetical protein
MSRWWKVLGRMLLSVTSLAQSIPPEQAVRGSRWDASHRVLFFGRGTLDRTTLPIRSYSGSGELQRGSDINLFKDFPKMEKAIIIDLTAGPNQTTILSAVLDFGSKVLRHVILTYDSSGALRSIWDTEPYMSWAIVADEKGNVFALGDKLLVYESGTKPYPLLNEYDSRGTVIGQFLYSDSFRNDARAVGPGNGRDLIYPVLTLLGGDLYIYAPVWKTNFWSQLHLEQLSGVSRLMLSVKKIAAADKVEFAGIHQIEFVDDSHIVLDLVDYSSGPELAVSPKAYSVNLDTQRYSLIERPQGAQVIGMHDDKLLMLAPSTDNHPVIRFYSVPRN